LPWDTDKGEIMNRYEKDHIERLRPYLAECTVLLKKNGAFPLDAPCTIAAYGSGVRDTVKGGTGSGEVNSRYSVSIEQGLRDAGFTIVNPFWPDMFKAFNDKAKKGFSFRNTKESPQRKDKYTGSIHGSCHEAAGVHYSAG
jgi:beta-glucosidase